MRRIRKKSGKPVQKGWEQKLSMKLEKVERKKDNKRGTVIMVGRIT